MNINRESHQKRLPTSEPHQRKKIKKVEQQTGACLIHKQKFVNVVHTLNMRGEKLFLPHIGLYCSSDEAKRAGEIGKTSVTETKFGRKSERRERERAK